MENDSDEFIAYATHLEAEHRRLRECLGGIERQWTDEAVCLAAKVTPQVIDALGTLRAELALHFNEEESGGCLEEAVSRAPSLNDEAVRLEHEHRVMLDHLDRLIEKLTAVAPHIRLLEEAKQDFRRFAKQLHVHEAAENRILEEGFGIDLE